MKTTNYFKTLILPAEDCTAKTSVIPPRKEQPTVANLHYDFINDNMGNLTSDDVIFKTYAYKNDINASEWEASKIAFFSKGQPCLRTSPLVKRYGWALYSDGEGKVQLVSIPSSTFDQLVVDEQVKKIYGMRTSRKA